MEELAFAQLRDTVERNFAHEAERRKLGFVTRLDPALGPQIATDPKRLLQVLKNLLSNAFKFTDQGVITFSAGIAANGWSPDHPVLSRAPAVVAFSVTDSGIGIPLEKQRIIFEAFQQADAGTSRKYGGTGLGLAISREIAGLLGGELRLHSEVGKGSVFTLFLPLRYTGPDAPHAARAASAMPATLASEGTGAAPVEAIEDDRDGIQPGDPVLLVVEDDPRYAAVLRDLARSRGFRVLVANRGSDALRLVREFRPSAVTLDIFLPDMLGWTVLARLKQDAATRHIPVQVVTVEEERHHSLERGAFAYIAKPATSELISEGNIGLMQGVKKFEPERGFRLATYAMWWIRASIQEFILRSWSLVKMGTTAAQKKLFFNLRKIKGQLKALEEGDLRPDQVKRIATQLGVTEEDVVSMNRRLAGDSSLNAPVRNDAETHFAWRNRFIWMTVAVHAIGILDAFLSGKTYETPSGSGGGS